MALDLRDERLRPNGAFSGRLELVKGGSGNANLLIKCAAFLKWRRGMCQNCSLLGGEAGRFSEMSLVDVIFGISVSEECDSVSVVVRDEKIKGFP